MTETFAHADPDFKELDPAILRTIERGIKGAVAYHGELTALQEHLLHAVGSASLGIELDLHEAAPVGENVLAATLAGHGPKIRQRVVQLMILLELILRPLPPEVAAQVARYAKALDVDDAMLGLARDYAEDSYALAMVDIQRNGYFHDWDKGGHVRDKMHVHQQLLHPFSNVDGDVELSRRWHALEHCAPGTLGRSVWEYYVGRGFIFPGDEGSVSPTLAQHDWIHVLADYGTVVDSELETFGFISAAIPDPRGFSFLAVVLGLFETGYVDHAAGGVLQKDVGHLERAGMCERLADALRRGRLCNRDVMGGIDYFEYVDMPLSRAWAALGIAPKSPQAIAAGSVGVEDPQGITAYQREHGDVRFQPPPGDSPDR